MKTWEMVKDEIKEQSESMKINIQSLEDEIDLVNELVNIRKAKNITQKELAEKINVPQSAISRFESQTNSPRLDTIMPIAKALGVQIGIIKPKIFIMNLPSYNQNVSVNDYNKLIWSDIKLN